MEKLIESILNETSIDFDIDEYKGNADTYISFSIKDMYETGFYDNENDNDRYFVTIHYWTKDLTRLSEWENIKNVFKEKGFIFKGFKGSTDKNYKGKLMEFMFNKSKI